jgi:hypothetical protein
MFSLLLLLLFSLLFVILVDNDHALGLSPSAGGAVWMPYRAKSPICTVAATKPSELGALQRRKRSVHVRAGRGRERRNARTQHAPNHGIVGNDEAVGGPGARVHERGCHDNNTSTTATGRRRGMCMRGGGHTAPRDMTKGMEDVFFVSMTVLIVASGDDMRITARVQPMRPMQCAAVAGASSARLPPTAPTMAPPPSQYFVIDSVVYLL